MITVNVYKSGADYKGFSVTDHSDFSEAGTDIVCAAVSSTVQFTANGITEVAGAAADISVDEENAVITLRTESDDVSVQTLLKAFALHLEILSEDYNENIKFCILEV